MLVLGIRMRRMRFTVREAHACCTTGQLVQYGDKGLVVLLRYGNSLKNSGPWAKTDVGA